MNSLVLESFRYQLFSLRLPRFLPSPIIFSKMPTSLCWQFRVYLEHAIGLEIMRFCVLFLPMSILPCVHLLCVAAHCENIEIIHKASFGFAQHIALFLVTNVLLESVCLAHTAQLCTRRRAFRCPLILPELLGALSQRGCLLETETCSRLAQQGERTSQTTSDFSADVDVCPV